MDKVRIGIVGMGTIAQTIHLPILSKLPEAEIVAACDVDLNKATSVAKKYGIPRCYDNYEDMLQKEDDIVAVDVCAPTNLHRDVAVAVLESKRDVLVEKPLARTQKESLDIVAAARKTHKQVMVGMNSRFRPDSMILKGFIEDKALGDIFYAKAGWFRKLGGTNPWLTKKEQSGGGVVLDLGIVMFDLAFWMMGYPEVKEVNATNYSHQTKGVEDSSIVFMKMKNGATMTIEASWSFESNQDFFYCDCYGTDGSGSLNPFRILKRMHGSLVNVAPASHETPQSLYRKSYENELKHWIGALRGHHAVISTGEESIHRMQIVDAIYRSAKLGKSIVIK